MDNEITKNQLWSRINLKLEPQGGNITIYTFFQFFFYYSYTIQWTILKDNLLLNYNMHLFSQFEIEIDIAFQCNPYRIAS